MRKRIIASAVCTITNAVRIVANAVRMQVERSE